MGAPTRSEADGGHGPAARSRAELVAAWTTLHGTPPPKGISTRLLTLAVAYAEQAKRHSGLSPKLRRRLAAHAEPPAKGGTAKAGRGKAAPGTRLMREWHGRTHVVDVLQDGVLYDGRVYRSLSEVARAITGARWSGPRFFGL